jgi:hypothetical protein
MSRLSAAAALTAALALAGGARAEPPAAAGPGAPEPATECNDPDLAMGGIAVGAMGAIGATAGLVLWSTDYTPCERQSNDVIACTTVGGAFGPILIGGSIVAAIATPMIVVGVWPVPVAGDTATTELRVGAGNADLSVRFRHRARRHRAAFDPG